MHLHSTTPQTLCVCGCGQYARPGNRYVNGHNRADKFVERFWAKVSRRGPDECWPWLGSQMAGGYGQMKYKQRNRRSHVIAYEFVNGAVPEGLFVCHACDNPICCNPAHLWLGTAQDNSTDMVRKGRNPKGDLHYSRLQPERLARGERNNHAKLTAEQVMEIRSTYKRGVASTVVLAKQYGVSQASIWYIVKRRTWTHVK